jgi:hypothetical protein
MKADVARVVVLEQARAQHERAERQRPPRRRNVQRRQRDQVPQSSDGGLALSVLGEPVTERRFAGPLRFERGVRVELCERERRSRRAKPLRDGEMAVARERAGEVQRRRQRAAAQ